MYIQETFMSKDTGTIIRRIAWHKTVHSGKKRLFRALQLKYGRCTSKFYVDTKEGKTLARGWIFFGKETSRDSHETSPREVRVEVATHRPVQETEDQDQQGVIPEAAIDRLLGDILAEKIQSHGSNWILDLPGVYEHLRFRWLEDVIARWEISQPVTRTNAR